MGFKESVLNVLRGSVAANIRFTFVAPSGMIVNVNGSSFQRAAAAMDNGRIEIDGNISHLSSPLAGAEYSSVNNYNHNWQRWFNQPSSVGRMVISPNLNQITQGFLIHKSLHASFDLTYSDFPKFEEEAAAYIAGALYYKAIGVHVSAASGSHYVIAARIADSISSTSGNAMPIIATAEIDSLARAVEASPTYYNYGHGSYLHDG